MGTSISFVAVSTASSPGVCAAPSGIVPGDVLVAFLGIYGNDDPTVWVSSGWTQRLIAFRSGGSQNMAIGVMTKVVGSSEPTSYTFTGTGVVENISVIVAAYRNVDNVNPWDTGTTNASGSDSSTFTGSSFVASSPGEMLIFGWFGDDNAVTVEPSGTNSLVARVDGTTFNVDGGFYGFYDTLLSSAGSTGDYSGTTFSPDSWLVAMGGLSPASLPPLPPSGPSTDDISAEETVFLDFAF